jgi:hypothetical protein
LIVLISKLNYLSERSAYGPDTPLCHVGPKRSTALINHLPDEDAPGIISDVSLGTVKPGTVGPTKEDGEKQSLGFYWPKGWRIAV